uniref:Glyco_hydro_92 n=1 Tax=uncultured Catenulispora sp. TaxID=487357 RepID=A0A060C6D2_9ACTN|nr:Glyco_hydro_92 [uncultured Catenulispora sp.]
MNAPYIYEWLGEPAKTTQVLDRIADELYDDTPGGLEGNDDLGALSSYYVWGRSACTGHLRHR